MSKIFKRPMFRKGGPTNGMTGIMSGIQDRNNYQVGGSARERLEKVYEEYPTQSVDPLSQFLIQGGLNLMSATPRGGALATAAEAFKEPTAGLFKGLGAEDRAKRELALAGEQLDIEQEQAKEIAEIKQKVESQYQKEFSPERKQYELYQTYTDPKNKGFTTSVEQDYPSAMADLGSYIQDSMTKTGLNQSYVGVVPYKKRGKEYNWNFDEMVAGGLYFKPDIKKLVQRDPEKNILIIYDPYTGKKLDERSLVKPK